MLRMSHFAELYSFCHFVDDVRLLTLVNVVSGGYWVSALVSIIISRVMIFTKIKYIFIDPFEFFLILNTDLIPIKSILVVAGIRINNFYCFLS